MSNITYTWEFPRFQAFPTLNGLKNVVFNVEYILSASDGQGHGAQLFGNVDLTTPDADSFRQFNLLTHRVVEQWVITALGEETLTDLKENLANQIAMQKTPPVVTLNKPW